MVQHATPYVEPHTAPYVAPHMALHESLHTALHVARHTAPHEALHTAPHLVHRTAPHVALHAALHAALAAAAEDESGDAVLSLSNLYSDVLTEWNGGSIARYGPYPPVFPPPCAAHPPCTCDRHIGQTPRVYGPGSGGLSSISGSY